MFQNGRGYRVAGFFEKVDSEIRELKIFYKPDYYKYKIYIVFLFIFQFNFEIRTKLKSKYIVQ